MVSRRRLPFVTIRRPRRHLQEPLSGARLPAGGLSSPIGCLLLVLLILPSLSAAATGQAGGDAGLVIADFARGIGPEWQEKSFVGKTRYEVVRLDGRAVLRATSTASASGLVLKRKLDLSRYPVLEWSWRIDHVLAKGDARTKAGDDYAARIYIVFPGTFFWQTRVVNYIWANRLAKGELIPNPYTKNVVMIAVESGNERAGQWVTERRHVLADFRRAFGRTPPPAKAIAIMTDTDNTGGSATAWYGPIRLLPAAQAP